MKASIFTFIGTFISYLNIGFIYSNVIGQKYKIKIPSLLIIAFLSLLNVFLILNLPMVLKLLCNIISIGLILFFTKKDNIKAILYFVFILWFIGALIDIVISSLLIVFVKGLLIKYPNLGLFIMSLVIQIIYNLFFRIIPIKKVIMRLKNIIIQIKSVIWIFILMIIMVIVFGLFAFKNYSSLGAMSLFLFLLFISVLLGLFLLKNLYEELIFKNTINNLLENNKYYVESNIKSRVFKHNIIHELNGIKSVADKKTNKLIDGIIKDNMLESTNSNYDDVLPNGINGIICRKLYNDNKVKLEYVINNYIKSDLFDVLWPRKYNRLCETIGLVLDNAVNASSKSKEKMLHIILLEDENMIKIKVINTFNDSLDVDKIGALNYTTNNNGHGLGLYSLIGKKDVLLTTKIINNLFECTIEAKKIKPPR